MPIFYQPPSWELYRETNPNNCKQKYFPDDPAITESAFQFRDDSAKSSSDQVVSDIEDLDDVSFNKVRPVKNDDGLDLQMPDIELPLKKKWTKGEKRQQMEQDMARNPRNYRRELFDNKQSEFLKQQKLIFGDIKPKKKNKKDRKNKNDLQPKVEATGGYRNTGTREYSD